MITDKMNERMDEMLRPSKSQELVQLLDSPINLPEWILSTLVKGLITGGCTYGIFAGADRIRQARARLNEKKEE